MNWQGLGQSIVLWGAQFGIEILGAILLWIVGRTLISFAIRLMRRALMKRPIEPTVINYLASTVSVLLNITLVVAILGYFGVQTTTFAALIASAGLAVGLAWSGLLSNFAAGAFLMILHPFKVGDLIQAPMGLVLAVRPYTNNRHYWQVYFDTNRLIRNTFGEAGFPAPGQFVFLKSPDGEAAFASASTD